MTTRSRPRPRGTNTYTARLQQRTAAARQRQHRLTRLTARPLPALLTLAAEAGHLAAALVEWPAAPIRGLVHILCGAGLGLFTAILYFGHSRVDAMLGTVSTLAIPVLWFAGAPVGLSLYQDFPLVAAIALSTVELGAATLLATHVRLTSPVRNRTRRRR